MGNKNDELNNLRAQLFPCHKEHKNYLFFKDNRDYCTCPTNNNHNEKCEWVSSRLYYFLANINSTLKKNYTLAKCNDIRSKIEGKKTEVELVNIDNKDDKIVIEVKSIRELNKVRHERVYSFDEFSLMLYIILDTKIKQNLKDMIKESALENFLQEHDLLLHIRDDIEYKKAKSYEFINDVATEICKVIFNNYLSALFDDVSIIKAKSDFIVDNINFTLVHPDEDTIEFFDIDGFTVFPKNFIIDNKEIIPPLIKEKYTKETFEEKIKIYYSDCNEKFMDFEPSIYKRILILNNLSFYDKDEIYNRVKVIDKPQTIDEVWLAFHSPEVPYPQYRKIV